MTLALKELKIFSKKEIEDRVFDSLERVGLWDEVKGRLNDSALSLSGGQQQRLCIARAIALAPKVLLMDEPTSSLDPVSTKKIEELIVSMKRDIAIVLVTHSLSQARRVADKVAFFAVEAQKCKVLEFGDTREVFNAPQTQIFKDFIQSELL